MLSSAVTSEPRLSEDINLGSGSVLDTGEVELEQVLTGLGPLRSSSSLVIKQRIQTCELVTGCSQESRFTVTGPGGDTLYWAKEHSGCLER